MYHGGGGANPSCRQKQTCKQERVLLGQHKSPEEGLCLDGAENLLS